MRAAVHITTFASHSLVFVHSPLPFKGNVLSSLFLEIALVAMQGWLCHVRLLTAHIGRVSLRSFGELRWFQIFREALHSGDMYSWSFRLGKRLKQLGVRIYPSQSAPTLPPNLRELRLGDIIQSFDNPVIWELKATENTDHTPVPKTPRGLHMLVSHIKR